MPEISELQSSVKQPATGPKMVPVLIPISSNPFMPGAFLNSGQMSGTIPKKPGKLRLFFSKIWTYCKKHRLPILKWGSIAAGSLLLLWLIFYLLPVGLLIAQTNKLATSSFSEAEEKSWAQQVNSFRYFKQPEATSKEGISEGDFGKAVLTYMNSYKIFNSSNLFKIPPLEIIDAKEVQDNLEPAPIETDNSLMVGYSYYTPPQHVSFQKFMTGELNIGGKVSPNLKFLLASVSYQSDNIRVKGTVDEKDVYPFINQNFQQLISALTAGSNNGINVFLAANDTDKAADLIADKTNLKLSGWTFQSRVPEAPIQPDQAKMIYIGQFKLNNNDLAKSGLIEVFYDYSLKQYAFDGLLKLSLTLTVPTTTKATASSTKSTTGNNSSSTSVTGQEITLQCSNCWLAPVDKVYKLSSNYAPKVVNTGLTGGGQLTSEAKTAMTNLFNAAAGQGIHARILSSYRSYSTQVTTFNYWVNQNMKGSSSRDEAIIKANRVSAMPGHSEHQLGTVADLKCDGCGDFDDSTANLALYQFLENNAYKYGFAISYPNGTEQYTGYKYEPWHVRYIGIDLAKEFYDTGYLTNNGNYLAKFLLQKDLY